MGETTQMSIKEFIGARSMGTRLVAATIAVVLTAGTLSTVNAVAEVPAINGPVLPAPDSTAAALATAITHTLPATLAVGTSADIEVLVTSADGAATGPGPVGAVALVVDEIVGAAVPLAVGADVSTATLTVDGAGLTVGAHQVRVDYTPTGTDFEPSTSTPVTLTVVKAASTVTAQAPTAVYGKSSVITVVVTGGTTTPTGRVTLLEGGKTLADAALTGGRATVKLAPTAAAGSHRITVTYAGDDGHAPASAVSVVSRTKATPAVRATASKAVYPGRGTVKVAVTGSGSHPTGTIAIRYKNTTVASGRVSAGRASIALPKKWKPGTRKLAVVYRGDSNYLTVSRSVDQTVSKATSKVTVGKLPTVAHDRKARFTVKVTSKAGTPTGAIHVRIKGKTVATAKLKGGKAKVTLPIRPVGTYSLDVRYLGSTTVRTSHAPKKMTVKFTLRGAKTFGDGLFKVNADVRPGLYRVKLKARTECLWAKSNSQGTSKESWRAKGYGLMRVLTTDTYFFSEGCGTWKLVSETPNWPFTDGTIPGDGTFIVGKDITPGIYYQSKANCYVGAMSDLTGHRKDVLWAGVTEGAAYIRILPEVFAVETLGCSELVRVA
ncbi:Ig-like domain repeat protein [Nakamurella silvestris]|nr:Ig-like domain repeat protein [Nakamurella silvestris]